MLNDCRLSPQVFDLHIADEEIIIFLSVEVMPAAAGCGGKNAELCQYRLV